MDTSKTYRVKRPTVGPIIKGQPFENDIGIWIRGKCKENHITYGMVKLDNMEEFFELSRKNDYVHIFNFDGLEFGTHLYQVGYVNVKKGKTFNINDCDWTIIPTYSFTINNELPLNFAFGSCRRLVRFLGIDFFGTGKEGDKIYDAIDNYNLDFMMNIGDKVYFDPTGNYFKYDSLESKRKLYRSVYNFPGQEKIHRSVCNYDICDDHDLHMNNSCQKLRIKHPKSFKNGLKAYYEYQHFKNPNSETNNNNNLYYCFEKKGSFFFVMDTRSKRCEIGNNKYIIDSIQESNFIEWITDPNKKDSYKFIVTPVPLLSQNDKDSWYGFPKQQRRILEVMLGKDREGNQIEKVIILTGDAHCARIGIYNIYVNDSVEALMQGTQYLGKIPEILSSGLVAINHDKGKFLTKYSNNINYNRDNDFPYIIDQTGKGGVKIKTSFSSLSYPNPHNATNLCQQLQKPFKRIVDNVFIKIKELKEISKLEIKIINQDNKILHTFTL